VKLPGGTGVTPAEFFELAVGFAAIDAAGFSDAFFFTSRLVLDDGRRGLPLDLEFDFRGDPFTFVR
jgi:hypothetical protein